MGTPDPSSPWAERVTNPLVSIPASNPPPSRPPPILSSSRLELQLKEHPAPLADIVKEYSLPRVVKCDRSTATPTRLAFDISQPLMLFTKRTARKVGACSVVFDKKTGKYDKMDDDIVVPEDYLGWFAVLGPPSQMKTEVNIAHFRNIHRLAISSCKEFLIGGTTCIKGFVRVYGQSNWEPCQIFPGEVLRKGAMYKEQREVHRKDKKQKKKKSKGVMMTEIYLGCYDKQDREILLHGAQEGLFYILTQDGAPVKNAVLHMDEILQRFKFPLLVKLLYGAVPTMTCHFKDTLLLTESAVSHSVIASTLENLKNINLEIPLDNDMKFYVAEQTQNLLMSRQYRQALADCNAKVPSYMRNMKVLFGAVPDGKFSLENNNTTDIATAPISEEVATEHVTSNDNNTPPLMRRHQSSDGSQRTSRLSIISRVITVNIDSQNIFTPDISPNPSGPPPPQSTKTKQPSFKTKHNNEYKNLAPQNLDLLQEFVPPESPEIIPAVQNLRMLSKDGENKQKAFEVKQDESHHYETPNQLFCTSEDHSDYDSLWQTSSTETNRESAAGFRINCKIGRPTASGRNVASGLSSTRDSDVYSERESWSSSVSSDSSSTYTSNSTHDDSPSISLPPVPVPDALSKQTLRKSAESTSQSQEEQRENSASSAAVTPSASALQRTQQQSCHIPLARTKSLSYLYNNLTEKPQYQNQQKETLSQTVASNKENGRYDNIISHLENGANLSGEYLVPLEIDHNGTAQSQVSTNPYENPSDIWRISSENEEGYVLYELNYGGDAVAPLTFLEGSDSQSLKPLPDHYDYPAQDPLNPTDSQADDDTSRSANCIYSVAVEMKESIISSPHPPPPVISPTPGAVRLPFASSTHSDKMPPPLPPNRPMKTPGSSTIDLISRIPGAITPTPSNKTNKEALIEEVKKVGLKPSSELAVRALQAADLAILSEKGDDLEDTLMALLPKVGSIDLRKIALCIKSLGISLVND